MNKIETAYKKSIHIQMSSFKNNESYKHKCAKEIFKKWCQSDEWKCNVLTNYSVLNEYNRYTNEIYWVPNRSQNAWLEYPIVVNDTTNSCEELWDEIWDFSDEDNIPNFVPTYEECVERNLYPIAVIDIVLPYKGCIGYCIEICHTNPVSNEKVDKLKKAGVRNLIEIDADWILNQTSIPSVVKVKRWLI
jgi:hypothetical protein